MKCIYKIDTCSAAADVLKKMNDISQIKEETDNISYILQMFCCTVETACKPDNEGEIFCRIRSDEEVPPDVIEEIEHSVCSSGLIGYICTVREIVFTMACRELSEIDMETTCLCIKTAMRDGFDAVTNVLFLEGLQNIIGYYLHNLVYSTRSKRWFCESDIVKQGTYNMSACEKKVASLAGLLSKKAPDISKVWTSVFGADLFPGPLETINQTAHKVVVGTKRKRRFRRALFEVSVNGDRFCFHEKTGDIQEIINWLCSPQGGAIDP